jgi:hypothetical protein
VPLPVIQGYGWKDLSGRRKRRQCEKLDCISFKTRHRLDFQLSSHTPCDSNKAKVFDGKLVATIVHGLIANDGGRRGQLWGITNAGTHPDAVGDCGPCDKEGHMEGRLAGEVYEGDKSLIDCRVFGSYAIIFEHSSGFGTTHAKDA